MSKFYLIVAIQLISLTILNAQTIKTKVLVVGSGATGIGAAIQSAHSGVNTLLIEESSQLGKGLGTIDTTVKIGLQGDFVRLYKSVQPLSRNTISAAEASPVLKSWTDTVKNLKVVLNAGILKIQRKGKNWKLRLSNGQQVKAAVLVDATENSAVEAQIGTKSTSRIPYRILNQGDFYSSNLYRTSVLSEFRNKQNVSVAPMAAFVSSNIENLVIVPNNVNAGIPATFASGQAAGATAAYCAFFEKTTKDINIRVIQGELLAYGSSLIPFADVTAADSNFASIQHIASTGILKAKSQNNRLYFQPDSSFLLQELRTPMKEYYSRSQIWFADKKDEKLTLNEAISLIKFVGLRGQELNKEIEKAWKTSFRFKSNFDLARTITKREFAVLVDTYLKPFSVRVDHTGKLLY